MIICTKYPTEFGKTLRFGEEEFTFDRLGCLEVDEEKGKELLHRYIDHLYPKEQKPTTEKVEDSYKADKVDKKITSLKEKIEKLEATILERDATIKAIEENNAEWKEVVDEKTKALDDLTKEFEDYKTVKEKEVDDLNLSVKLAPESVEGLKDKCRKMGIEEAKFAKLTKKAELINLILEESRK